MVKSQEEFFRELLDDFKIEAAEHQKAIADGMLKLEKNPPLEEFQSIVETTFRELHSLKGASRAVNQIDIEKVCQTMEGVFHQLKDGKATLMPPLFDLLLKGVDLLTHLLSESGQGKKANQGGNLSQLLKAIDNQLIECSVVQKSVPPENYAQSQAMKKITVAENNIEPVISLNLPPSAEQQLPKETVRIATSKLNHLLRQTEEFITAKATLAFLIQEIERLNIPDILLLQRDLGQFGHSFAQMVDELLFDMKSTLLFPFSSLTDMVPRIVRDLSKEFGKGIDITVTGAETEIDRRILEEMKDPLIHLIRNCIDHGIEKPEIRLKNGKSPNGTLKLKIVQEAGRHVELILSDDGAGIDRERLKESALKNSVVSRETLDQMNDQEILYLIFRSGVSTSPIITDLSGRGLGMAIVASKVDGLGGSLTVESVVGKGTKFVITLPLTLSTFRGILVKVNNQTFVMPTTAVERALRIKPQEVKYVKTKPFLSRNGKNIALVGLADVLALSGKQQKQSSENSLSVLIVASGYRKIGFLVDEIIGEQEGIVKDLGPQLVHVQNIAGATVLGNGQIIPILHVPELINSALNAQSTLATVDQGNDPESPNPSPKRILVAEDSITSRALIRNILETAGFHVKSAVDGLEAFHFLQGDQFDLVVSDVEMPGMNGFELTAKIKNDARFNNIPVILVTSLSSDYDRRRGLEAGANAYIVKSNFEQSNLVETIQRLI